MLKTPIIDNFKNKNLLLGDFVLDEKGYCGVLSWCNYYNRYFTKTSSGGNIYSRTYTKIKKLQTLNDINKAFIIVLNDHITITN